MSDFQGPVSEEFILVRVVGWDGMRGVDSYMCWGCGSSHTVDLVQKTTVPPKLCLNCSGHDPYGWVKLVPDKAKRYRYTVRSGIKNAVGLRMLCFQIQREHREEDRASGYYVLRNRTTTHFTVGRYTAEEALDMRWRPPKPGSPWEVVGSDECFTEEEITDSWSIQERVAPLEESK